MRGEVLGLLVNQVQSFVSYMVLDILISELTLYLQFKVTLGPYIT